ncbi:MAG TPA: YncE family protein [Cyclobacteriaceae bacterium]|nr:YncE family protein [Cyclobacteriaceae bacterium]
MKIPLVLLMHFFSHFMLAQELLLPDEKDINATAIAIVHIKGYPDFLTEDENGMWLTNEERVEKLQYGMSGTVLKINVPRPCGVMAVGFGSVWVASCEQLGVYRINISSGAIESIIQTGLADEEGELSLAIGAGSVWVLSDSKGVLSRINPQTNKIVSRIKVEPNSFAAAFGNEAIWISNTKSASVQKIDPISEKVIATIPVGKGPRFLTAGAGAIWTLNQEDGTVSKIDPVTHLSLSIDLGVKGTGGDIATGARFVYVRAKNVLLSVIDPTSNKVISRFGPASGSGAVRVEHGRVWVTAHDINTIWILKE